MRNNAVTIAMCATVALWGCGTSTTPPASIGGEDGADAIADDAGATDGGAADAVKDEADAGLMDTTDAGPTDAGKPDVGEADAGNDNGCTSEQSCKGGQMCFVPGESIGCGMCQQPPDACQSDLDCATGGGKPKICIWQKNDCTCSGEKLCHDGCTSDNDCAGPWQSCAPDNHCVAKACAANADCPVHFSCAAGSCARVKCKASGDCPGGFCVKGQCYPKKGFCSYLPA